MQAFSIPVSLLHRIDDSPELLKALVAYDAHEFEDAIELLEPIARSGNVLAIYKLANSLDWLGNDELAEHFWRIAVGTGHVSSANNLANLLKETNRREEARELYLFGANLGEADPMFNLGLLLEEDDPEASIEWMKKAIEAGHAKACAVLSMRYFRENLSDLGFFYARKGIDRNDGYSALSIAMHYKELDDWDRVHEYATLALTLSDPLRESWVKHALAFIAFALFTLGRSDETERAVQACVEAGVDQETIAVLEQLMSEQNSASEFLKKCTGCGNLERNTKFCTGCGAKREF